MPVICRPSIRLWLHRSRLLFCRYPVSVLLLLQVSVSASSKSLSPVPPPESSHPPATSPSLMPTHSFRTEMTLPSSRHGSSAACCLFIYASPFLGCIRPPFFQSIQPVAFSRAFSPCSFLCILIIFSFRCKNSCIIHNFHLFTTLLHTICLCKSFSFFVFYWLIKIIFTVFSCKLLIFRVNSIFYNHQQERR